jgi:beta-carotene 3-hydroxylase
MNRLLRRFRDFRIWASLSIEVQFFRAVRVGCSYIGRMTLTHILIIIATFLAMEFVAWSSHKYIMHGWGWGWHRDHHEPHTGTMEKNDLYGVVGAVMSISMFAIGSPLVMGAKAWEYGTAVGLGILAYGLVYTFIHDGIVHQRFFKYVPKRGYAKRLVQAHKLHHATVGKEGGVSFGFVFARDPATLKAELKAQREAGVAVVRDAVGRGF